MFSHSLLPTLNLTQSLGSVASFHFCTEALAEIRIFLKIFPSAQVFILLCSHQ